jgi:hypothetical protein
MPDCQDDALDPKPTFSDEVNGLPGATSGRDFKLRIGQGINTSRFFNQAANHPLTAHLAQ